MAGVMGAAFNWTPDQFWQSTPHECWAVIEQHQEMHDVEDA
jgi:hypothetical protein